MIYPDMKKLIGSAITGLTFLSIGATSAFAGGNVNPCTNMQGAFGKLCNLNANNLGGIVGAVVTFILILAVLIALFFLIWGGIKWITSGGDKGKVDAARQTITAAIVGLIIAFLAFFILQVALGFFGLSLTNLVLPKIT